MAVPLEPVMAVVGVPDLAEPVVRTAYDTF